ncbi:hypothetical protein SSX86_004615 [Deinandra increscens subsp. villosa]|uniref:EF-hand domain-containing protein n=1 Tax=Deinandra increscens subsp. villosa TaxID=3103831 RepID=A0AAP0DNX1_9ASTR
MKLGPDGASQLSMASRPSALLSGAHYGGQYASVYGSASHNSALQTDIYDRLDVAAAAVRQELLQSRSLQPASVDGSSSKTVSGRQADYLAARAAAIRHLDKEILPYGGRIDTDLHTLSMIRGTQHAPSILGAAPRREVEDLVYTHSSANPGYGVSLPPGRDHVSGKSLHGTSVESAYLDGVLARVGYSRIDDLKDAMAYARDIERREEDRHREIIRDRDRDRDREREREREREHRRERERILKRREKEREREIRRSRSPIRISRDRGLSISAARGRSSRRESLRRHSPVREKRREYVCKVYTSNLVHTERDYLSMNKRYSRLFVSPECSKVIINWSKEDLNIPLNTPISFEHDFVQGETPSEHESASIKTVTNGQANLQSGTTRWNAKMLLMSGLSRNAWEELLSERKYDDRIPHLCNMLRFAFLKKGNSLMAIGGSWDTVDGNDPSVNKSTLIQTVSRYAKELTGLDLKNCQNWNPFLEIHYDRIGKDGFFSHKEITVLYIPDLSDCLPSIDAWRDQWLAHKKAVAERERLHALKREKSRDKKEVSKEKAGKEGDKIVTEKKDKDKTITEKKDECSDDKTKIEDELLRMPILRIMWSRETKQGRLQMKTNQRTMRLSHKMLVVQLKLEIKVKKFKRRKRRKTKVEAGSDKNENLKGGKEKKDKDVKTETKGKQVNDKKKVEEPPRHPGLILQTKGDKYSKLRSLSLSLDSLLDYTDKDIEESTFELSLFAETFYEMLQYQMGSRILIFLQKLRIKFVAKRNRRKRQREEASDKKEKEKTKTSSAKHQKTDVTVESKSVKTETLQEDEKDMVIDDEDITKKEDESEKDDSKEKPEDPEGESEEDLEEEPEEDLEEEPEEDPEEEPEEDTEEEPEEDPEEEPEEDPEEDEHMADAIPKSDADNEEKAEVDKVDMNMNTEKKDEKVKSEPEDDSKVTVNLEKIENSKVDTNKKKETLPAIDKELLQAFRFFDRNRVGYIRVEDLRLILHSLGKCTSHRDVKELVQCALLESNTGRDDHILYKKLVKMTDI